MKKERKKEKKKERKKERKKEGKKERRKERRKERKKEGCRALMMYQFNGRKMYVGNKSVISFLRK